MENRCDFQAPIKSIFSADKESSLNENQLSAEFAEKINKNTKLTETICATEMIREHNTITDAKKNNVHHVVPIGVLIVLVTIYLGMNGVQKSFVSCFENQAHNDLLGKSILEGPNVLSSRNLKPSQILERLLEYKDICKDLEIFTKEINIQYYRNDNNEIFQDGGIKAKLKRIYSSGDGEKSSSGSGSGSGSGNGEEACAKSYSKKIKKTKHLIKVPTNSKNGFHKHNKSTKAKYTRMDKKDLNVNKKNSTAEPIIYLFALVFIYLLLKAASDINQHYKLQTKNDKRLRRCSLQSYAQIHRPDRRASKAPSPQLALKQKQRAMAGSTRSICISEQQQAQQDLHHHRYQDVCSKIPVPSTPATQLSIRVRTAAPNSWQLLRQHITTQSVDNSDLSTSHMLNSDAAFFSQDFTAIRSRRCSVPVALNYHQKQVPTTLPLALHSNDPLTKRRTSISMSLDPIDGLATTEIKRRVRMINRH